MPTVYVVQEIKKSDGTPVHDITPAAVYGELEVLIDWNYIGIAVQPIIKKLRHKLRDFSDEDYLLMVGDPVAMGIACSVASDMNRGRVNILKWDRQTRQYVAIKVNLRPSREGEKDGS